MVLSETCKADAFSEHFQTAENKCSFCFHWVKHIAKGGKRDQASLCKLMSVEVKQIICAPTKAKNTHQQQKLQQQQLKIHFHLKSDAEFITDSSQHRAAGTQQALAYLL